MFKKDKIKFKKEQDRIQELFKIFSLKKKEYNEIFTRVCSLYEKDLEEIFSQDDLATLKENVHNMSKTADNELYKTLAVDYLENLIQDYENRNKYIIIGTESEFVDKNSFYPNYDIPPGNAVSFDNIGHDIYVNKGFVRIKQNKNKEVTLEIKPYEEDKTAVVIDDKQAKKLINDDLVYNTNQKLTGEYILFEVANRKLNQEYLEKYKMYNQVLEQSDFIKIIDSLETVINQITNSIDICNSYISQYYQQEEYDAIINSDDKIRKIKELVENI